VRAFKKPGLPWLQDKFLLFFRNLSNLFISPYFPYLPPIINVSKFLQLIVIMKLLIATNLCYPHGIMECWSSGVAGSKNVKKAILIVFLPLLHRENLS